MSNELDRAGNEAVQDPFAGVDFGELELSLYRPRTLFSVVLSWVVGVMTFLALVPLFAVLWMLIWRGGQKLSLALFTQLPCPAATRRRLWECHPGNRDHGWDCIVDHCGAWHFYRGVLSSGER